MMHTSFPIVARSAMARRPVRLSLIASALAVTIVLCLGAAMSSADASAGGGNELQFEDTRMIIEFNSTDQDVGVQVFLDGEEWRLLRVFDPSNRKILEITGTRALRLQGLTELFFESSEPSLDELSLDQFFARFPEGTYDFEGVTIDGEPIEGEAIFTHAIPDGPVILTPQEDSVQNPNHVVVDWQDVADPPGSEIVAYQVIVTQQLNVRPERTFSVHVPASVTSVTVPSEFLRHGANYEFEVLAIEAGGNQTITASTFSTQP